MSATIVEDRRLAAAAAERMTIRDAREADLPAIINIYNAAIATRIATAQLEPFWVLEIDRSVAGWLTLKPFLPRCAYRGTAEVSVYVDEKFRRRGIARTLLGEAIVRGPSLEINAMVGLIFAHNKPSLKLFEQLGFEKWGLLPRVARLDQVERDLTIMGRHV